MTTPERDASSLGVAPNPAARPPWQRALYLTLAVASLGMAVVGVIVPGLPSTEFVLLASWAAARSSPRLHRWLNEHRWFGPMLHHWRNGRRVPRRAKYAATVSMSACAVLMVRTVPHAWVVWPACLSMAIVLVWLWRRPEPARVGLDAPSPPSRLTADASGQGARTS